MYHFQIVLRFNQTLLPLIDCEEWFEQARELAKTTRFTVIDLCCPNDFYNAIADYLLARERDGDIVAYHLDYELSDEDRRAYGVGSEAQG